MDFSYKNWEDSRLSQMYKILFCVGLQRYLLNYHKVDKSRMIEEDHSTIDNPVLLDDSYGS